MHIATHAHPTGSTHIKGRRQVPLRQRDMTREGGSREGTGRADTASARAKYAAKIRTRVRGGSRSMLGLLVYQPLTCLPRRCIAESDRVPTSDIGIIDDKLLHHDEDQHGMAP